MTRKIDIERATEPARRIVDSFVISHPREIDLEGIARGCDCTVLDGPLAGAEARLVQSKSGMSTIRVKSGIKNLGRRRFALAHEIGHRKLHRRFHPNMNCSEIDLSGFTKKRLEIEANYFAAELLMPTRMFQPQCIEGEPSIYRIRRLSEEFQVSVTAAAIRFVEECNHYCVVVFSKNGIIKGWRDRADRYNDFSRRFWIPVRNRVHEGTVTWRCLIGEQHSSEMGRVDPTCWLPESSHRDVELREQSISLGPDRGTITLLWFGL